MYFRKLVYGYASICYGAPICYALYNDTSKKNTKQVLNNFNENKKPFILMSKTCSLIASVLMHMWH